jgi:hypothetical protein
LDEERSLRRLPDHASAFPDGGEDFVYLVIPQMQRRGIFRQEYSGSQLRDHLRGYELQRICGSFGCAMVHFP